MSSWGNNLPAGSILLLAIKLLLINLLLVSFGSTAAGAASRPASGPRM